MRPANNRIAGHFAALGQPDPSKLPSDGFITSASTPRHRFQSYYRDAQSTGRAGWGAEHGDIASLVRAITVFTTGVALVLAGGPVALVAAGSLLCYLLGLSDSVRFDAPTTLLAFAVLAVGYLFLFLGGFSALLLRRRQE